MERTEVCDLCLFVCVCVCKYVNMTTRALPRAITLSNGWMCWMTTGQPRPKTCMQVWGWQDEETTEEEENRGAEVWLCLVVVLLNACLEVWGKQWHVFIRKIIMWLHYLKWWGEGKLQLNLLVDFSQTEVDKLSQTWIQVTTAINVSATSQIFDDLFNPKRMRSTEKWEE